jgi:hypothetical protein
VQPYTAEFAPKIGTQGIYKQPITPEEFHLPSFCILVRHRVFGHHLSYNHTPFKKPQELGMWISSTALA